MPSFISLLNDPSAMTDDLWRPSAALQTLKQRAALMSSLRRFFAEREVLEVETPLLARFGVTDPYMDLLTADNPLHGSGADDGRYYLQSSPEYAMKRLLAAGSGPIYQICKAFRAGEQGGRHNPEFSMLEWYRPGFDHHQLMAEIAELLVAVLDSPEPKKISYGELFEQYLSIDPHCVSIEVLELLARQHLDIQMVSDNRDDWLNLLIAEVIEPKLGFDAPTFIYDYPASQAALAKLSVDQHGRSVAQRFELYINGVELANGYYELTDSVEQRRRMRVEQQQRIALERPQMAADAHLLAALDSGLPECAGVALGLDRLVMLALGCEHIEQVLSFSAARA